MIFGFQKINFFVVSILAFCAFCAPVHVDARSASNAADPDWRIHSSFYNTPRRIFDSPDRVIFFLHPGIYNANEYRNYFSDVAGSIFAFDKNNPAAPLKDLTNEIPFSSLNMKLMDVNPADGAFAVAYTDGGIDYVDSNGKITYFSALSEMHDYRMSKINNLRFDAGSGKLLVTTEGGFVYIDPVAKTVSLKAEWRQNVDDVVKAGNFVFAIINDKIHRAPADADLSSRSSFTLVPGATSDVPLRLLAFAGNWAGYLAENGSVHLLDIQEDGSCVRSHLVNLPDAAKSSKNSFVNKFEHTLFPVPGGYVFNSKSKVYKILTPDGGGKPVCTTINAPQGATPYAGTADGINFWFHQDYGKFVARSLNGASWSEPSVTVAPECPHGAKDVYFFHSPEYGFLSVNKAPGFKSSQYDIMMPITISALRNGRWTDLSPRKDLPYFVADDPTALSNYNKSPWYPMYPANGAMIDPLFPNLLLTANHFYGFAGLHLDDPRLKPHVHTFKDSPYATQFGALEMFPKSNWGNMVAMYLMGADADNNIWATRSNLMEVSGTSDNLSQLWVLTPEARKAAFESGNPDICGQWKHMEVDGGCFTELFVMGATLRHPKNKNKFLLNGQFNNGNGRPMRIYNTNGTLDDMSDDTITDVNFFRRDDGYLGNAENIFCYLEDPANGDVYVFTNSDAFIVDLDKPINNNTMEVRSFSIKTEEGNLFTPFQPTLGIDACLDEFGRLWIASSNVGVYGLSQDRTKLVAHFNKDNSPLSSNYVYAVGWNPETKSLFMSTSEAIFEVKVDNPDHVASYGISSTTPRIAPMKVTPDFAGTVSIYDIPAAVSIRVRDANGNTVAEIADVKDGCAYWNLLDRDGNQVKSGVYSIEDASGIPAFKPITLTVIR
ncbi:MAG: hypothetical protein K2G67_06275 [Muribaculaceae bacterium]|nr:hypothetical protein [Muribaculaceae bacterium]